MSAPSDSAAGTAAMAATTAPAAPGADPRDAYFDVSGLRDGLGARAGRGSVLVLAVAALKFALHLVSTVIIARLVPPAEYGIASLAMPVVMIAISLSQFGLAQPIVQQERVGHRLVNTLFWVNLALGLGFGGLLAALSGPMARFYGEPAVGPVFVVLGLSVVFASLSTQYVAILRRRMEMKRLELAGLAAFAGAVTVAVSAAAAGASYWAVVLQQILVPTFTVVLLAATIPWRPAAPWTADLRDARGALRFGGDVAAAGLLQQFAIALPTIAAGRVLGATATGLYYRSQTLANLVPARVVGPLAGVSVATLSRLQQDPAGFRAMFGRLTTRINLLLLPFAALMAACADLVVAVLLGPDWAPMAPVLAIMSLLILQATAEHSFTWALISAGASRQFLVSAVLGVAVTAAAVAAGVGLGVVGLAAVYMGGSVLVRLPAIAALVLRHTPLDFATLARTLLADIAFCVLVGGGVMALRAGLGPLPVPVELALAAAAIAVAYGGRIAVSPALRADIGKVLALVRDRLPGAAR